MAKVSVREKHVKDFNELAIGDAFLLERDGDEAYIKIKPIETGEEHTSLNAVCINDGKLRHISRGYYPHVKKVDKVILEVGNE